MTVQLMSALVVASGVLSSCVGIATAMHRLRIADRIQRRTATIYDTMPDGWNSWFLSGFSSLTVGTHWLWAGIGFAGWVIAGSCLIWLGLRLLRYV